MSHHEHHHSDPGMSRCIEDCLACYQTCRETSMHHCLETGGRHVEPEHFRLMVACAEICRTAADIMLTRSSLHVSVCAACAEICDACAKSCADLDGMEECAEACNRCAESCRTMASGASPTRGHAGHSTAARHS